MTSSIFVASPSRSELPASPPSLYSPLLDLPHQILSPSPPQLPQVARPLPPSRWLNLFNNDLSSSSTALKHFSPEFMNGIAKVPSDVVSAGVSKWSKFLIGSFIGKRLPFFMVKKEIERVLKAQNSFNLSCDGNRYFFEISDSGHRQKLHEGGPIFIAGRILVIREWSSSVEEQEDQLPTIPLWINIVIPRELWTVEGIGFCASLFGTPLGMDEFTAKMTKTRFARVCVEVGVNFEYLVSIPVDLATRISSVNVEYKWKAEACSGYSTFGHSLATCPKGQKINTQEKERRWQPVANNSLQQEIEDVPEIGILTCDETSILQPVAVTQTRNRHGESKSTCLNEEEVSHRGNKFDILASLEDNENITKEISVDTGAAVNPIQNTPIAQLTQIQVNDSGVQLTELREQSNQRDSGVMMEKTNNFVDKVGDCLEICDVVLNSLQSNLGETSKQTVEGAVTVSSDSLRKDGDKGIIGRQASIVDKGGTKFDPSKFDPSNSETWTEAMREADHNIAMVMARMQNPEPVKSKPTKMDLRVKLVRGNSGAPIRSSTRNKQ